MSETYVSPAFLSLHFTQRALTPEYCGGRVSVPCNFNHIILVIYILMKSFQESISFIMGYLVCPH